MTLEELENNGSLLPNGLHDALLLGLRVDYASRQAEIEVIVDLSEPNKQVAERYRTAIISLTGLIFLVVDPPAIIEEDAGELFLTSGSGQPSTSVMPFRQLPQGAFLHWLFVDGWNAFIRIAARGATLRWK